MAVRLVNDMYVDEKREWERLKKWRRDMMTNDMRMVGISKEDAGDTVN